MLQNGVKRPSSKTKKRVKDLAPLTNGWPRHDRNSASPRDIQPPSKRPKTSHRTSNSTSQPPRKRSASSLHNRSASYSPDYATRTYSPEFIQAYRNDDFTVPDANCLGSLEVGSKLSQWLTEPEEFFRASGGKEQHDLFSRLDDHISTIDYQSELIEIQEAHDPRVSSDGMPVTWKYLTVKEPLSQQAFIGELRGTVGLKEDYEADPSNRWSIIRHPEPFVFYYAHLPIYVDTRQEGTWVRYIRRSCNPNAELKIIITGNDYHFCFIATRDIEAGEEVAIAWDCARTIADMISARNTDGARIDLDSLQQWITMLLSNCGPCACGRVDCLMARFDRRFIGLEEPKKGRKKKQQISPLNTMANSRSGSEVRKLDEDEGVDSRSTSGSGKSVSRDITPNTHYSTSGSGLPELSERERKKLLKEEEMFKRQEEQAVVKTKKKRPSGGLGKPARYDVNGKKSVKRTKTVVKARSRPVYADADTQCDMDAEEAAGRAKHWESDPHRRRAYNPLHQRLIERCHAFNGFWRQQAFTLTLEQDVQAELPWNGDARPEDMKLEMPPPLPNPFAVPAHPATTPLGLVTVQSPGLQSPSIQSAITPVRKKLSLSDYTRRSKAKETEPKSERESSPSSIASGPAPAEKTSNGLASVMEDAEMHDSLPHNPDVQMVAGT